MSPMDLRSSWAQLLTALRSDKVLLALGYVLAVVLPIVGFFLGIVILIRRRTWHGVAIVGVSIVAAIGFLVIVSEGGDEGGTTPAMEREYRRIKDCLEREFRNSNVDEVIRACAGRPSR